jgi:hypothetical protein
VVRSIMCAMIIQKVADRRPPGGHLVAAAEGVLLPLAVRRNLLVDGGRHRKLVLIRDVSHPHIVRRSVRILPRGVWSAPRVDAGRAHALAVSGTRRPADRAKGAAALQKVPDRRGAYIPERGSGKRAAQVSCGTSVVWSSVNPAFAWQSSAAAKGAPQMKAVQSRRSRASQAVNCNRPCDTPYVSTAETVTEGAESVQFLMRRRLDACG